MKQLDGKISFWAIIVIFALLAGGIGGFFMTSFGPSILGFGSVSEVTPDYANRSRLVIQEAKKVVVEQNDQVQSVASGLSESLLAIVKKSDKKNDWQKDYYDLANPLGEALVVTSDGWLVSNSNDFSVPVLNLSDYLLIDREHKIYAIDKVVKDDYLGVYFIHIDAKSLPVKKMSDTVSDQIGSLFVAANWQGDVFQSSLVNIKKPESPVLFSDDLNQELNLDKKIDKNFVALLNFAGELVGVVNKNGQVMSARNLNLDLAYLLNNKVVKRPSLGLYYIDFERVAAKDSLLDRKYFTGVLLDNKSIIPGGAADLAGLKAGDRLISLNQAEIRGNLQDLLLSYQAGQSVNISYERGGKVVTVALVLGAQK